MSTILDHAMGVFWTTTGQYYTALRKLQKNPTDKKLISDFRKINRVRNMMIEKLNKLTSGLL